MADEARTYVRAAQEAELRGDLSGAVGLLIRAAATYRDSGRPGRALTMLKHASRLDPSRPEVEAELARLKSAPGESLPLTGTPSAPEEWAELPAQARALEALALNLGWGRTRILLLGAEGSGKTAVL